MLKDMSFHIASYLMKNSRYPECVVDFYAPFKICYRDSLV